MTSVRTSLLVRKLWSADSAGLKRPCIAWLAQRRAYTNHLWDSVMNIWREGGSAGFNKRVELVQAFSPLTIFYFTTCVQARRQYSRHSVRLLLSVSHASSRHSVRLLLSVSQRVQSSLSPPTAVSVPTRPVVTRSSYYCQCPSSSVRLLYQSLVPARPVVTQSAYYCLCPS